MIGIKKLKNKMVWKNKEKAREYYQIPEVKKRQKDYQRKYRQRPEVKAKAKTRMKEYYQENKDKIKERAKEYYQENKEKSREIQKKYRQKNEDKIKERAKEYFQRPRVNKRGREYHKKYRQENKENLKQYFKKYNKEKLKRDINFRISCHLRTLIWISLNTYTKMGKIMSSKKYGIDYKAIIEHLKPFPEDISLYHIDHIRPLCSFNLEDSEEIKKAFAPENHQWLTIQENLVKGGRILS